MALEQYANNAASVLAAAMPDAIGTTLTVASASTFPTVPQFRLRIDAEIVIVTAVAGAVFTVTRGAEGTTAASHAQGAPVTHVLTAGSILNLPNRLPNLLITSPTSYYLDPLRTLPTSGDTNDGLSPSTALVTYAQLATRWGSYAPRSRGNLTLNFLSGQPDNTDPVYFEPFIENGASVLIVGTPTLIASGTLGTVTAKNRATPQLLNAVLTSGLSAGQLIVNSTHASKAWLYSNVAGSTWAITQPFVSSLTTVAPAEVDTWAPGDAYAVYSLPSVHVRSFRPTFANYNVGVTNFAVLQNVSIPPGASGFDPTIWRPNNSIVLECAIPSDFDIAPDQLDQACGLVNNFVSGSVRGFGLNGFPVSIIGGAVTGSMLASGIVTIGGDIIIGGTSAMRALGSVMQYSSLYLDTGKSLIIQGSGNFASSNAYGGPIFYGPGLLNLTGTVRCTYPSGAGKAVATFQQAGGFQLNSQTSCVLVTPGSALTAGKTLSAANLDADLGAVVGAYVNIGGASITNGLQ